MPKATTVVLTIALLLFSSSTHAADFKMPPDSTLEQWMRQPVEETLKGTGVVYVNDANYQREVFGAGKPVMVLFYAADDGSKGLGALVRILNQRFPQIKACAYKETDEKVVRTAQVQHLKMTYGLKDTPALLFYKHEGGKVSYKGDDWQSYRGIAEMDNLKQTIKNYLDYIPRDLLK